MALNWESIDRLAKAHRLIDPTASEDALFRALKIWWCVKFNRPLKDPMIASYTLDELVYEYLIHFYMNPDNDPSKKKEEEKAATDDEEWIKKQLQQLKASDSKTGSGSPSGGNSPPGPVQPESTKPNRTPVQVQEPDEIVPELPDLSTSFEE